MRRTLFATMAFSILFAGTFGIVSAEDDETFHNLLVDAGTEWPVPGEPADIEVWVHENGFFPDETVPETDLELYIDGALVTQARIPSFKTAYRFVHTWTPTAGLHEIRAVVDASEEVVERYEDDNMFSWWLNATTDRPDLTIENVSVETDEVAMRLEATYDFCNRGTAATSLTQPSGWRQPDVAHVTLRASGADRSSFLGGIWTPLDPGECVSGSATWERDMVVGQYEVVVRALCWLCGDVDLENNMIIEDAGFFGADAGVPGRSVDVPGVET